MEADELFSPIEILNKYLIRKFRILTLINERNKLNIFTTVIDIKESFKITNKYAYKLLGELKKDKSIREGKKVKGYYSYLITEKTRRELELLSKILNGNINLKFQ